MHIEGLDDIDNKILEIIKENARMSYSDIGEKVGISRVSVKTKMQQLEENGIIQGYHTIIDPSKAPEAITFFLDIETTPEDFDIVCEKVGRCNIIRQLYTTSGDCRLHATGLAMNTRHIRNYVDNLYANLKGVKKVSLHIALSTLKDVGGGIEYESKRAECNSDN